MIPSPPPPPPPSGSAAVHPPGTPLASIVGRDQMCARARIVEKRDGRKVWLRASHSSYDTFELVVAGKVYLLSQRPSLHVTLCGSTGGSVWDASLVLAKYIENNPHVVVGKRVLELGAGVAAPSVAAAAVGASEVLMTELPELQPLLQSNLPLHPSLRAEVLVWGQPDVSHLHPPLDVVLGAEVTVDIFPADELLASLLAITGPNSLVLIAHEDRSQDGRRFFGLAEKFFHIQEVLEGLDPLYTLPDVHLFRLMRLPKKDL